MRISALRLLLALLPAQFLSGQYAGSGACRTCHAAKYESQSKTGHARALAATAPGSPGQWAFGAGEKATTWVSQSGADTIVEHGMSYYSATKTMGLTPGHATPADVTYRTFDPIGTALRCFRCHSTGPVKLTDGFRVEPTEKGVRCEACHGPGGEHVKAKGAMGTILNPGRLKAAELNEWCGACHRQASTLDDDTDWENPWNVRHQPSYLHRAACFRNSDGALSCTTCHNPHEPLRKTTASYDARCVSCHKNAIHKPATGSCIGCHMPQVAASPGLRFTNHWIGIYEKGGKKLAPGRRAVKSLRPAATGTTTLGNPSGAATLSSVYENALRQREKVAGVNGAPAARGASDLGLFLMQVGDAPAAEPHLRRALTINKNIDHPAIDADRENLAAALEANGKIAEALALYGQASAGRDSKIAARSFASMARLDSARADSHYRKALEAEQAASGLDDRRVAVLLHELALTLREKGADSEAEPLLRRALAIQNKLVKPDYRLTVAILNTLGNLLEGGRHFDEAERLERLALRLSEQKFGPESRELAMTLTNLADVLWSKKDLMGAAHLFKRAILVDAALYGPNRPETAADVANLGTVMKEAGQVTAGDEMLRRALAIYEQTLGPASAQAGFVRERLRPRQP